MIFLCIGASKHVVVSKIKIRLSVYPRIEFTNEHADEHDLHDVVVAGVDDIVAGGGRLKRHPEETGQVQVPDVLHYIEADWIHVSSMKLHV